MNRALLQPLCYDDPAEVVGPLTVDNLIHPGDRALLAGYRDNHRLGFALPPLEIRWLRKDGQVRAIQGTSRRLVFAGTPGILVVAQLVEVKSLVENTEKLLRRIVGEDIVISTRLAPGHVFADPTQLEQVVMNLVVNARDAMPGGGALTLECADTALDDVAAACRGVGPGRYHVIAVSDTGCGMDEATRRHIFEPFFTTKEAGRGTGLGLATCSASSSRAAVGSRWTPSRGVARSSGSTCRAPRRARPTTRRDRARSCRAGARESILVVDDDLQLRAVIHRRLRALGYQTFDVPDAKAAVAALRATPAIDLLLTDLVMPGIDGRTLAAKLVINRLQARLLQADRLAALGT